MPIEKHIEKVRNKAAKDVRKEGTKMRIGGFLLIILVMATAILWVFF